jgi:hypothetical protein
MLLFVDRDEIRDEHLSAREASFSARLQRFTRRSSCDAKDLALSRERPATGGT